MWNGERLESTNADRDIIEHLHRYALALEYTHDKIVLDIASGEGYGVNLISKHAKFVYGVDIDESVVEYSNSKYNSKNSEFLVGNTSNIPLKDNSVDLVTSFETIEHHAEHQEMMLEIKRVLKPDGILIISTPDKHFYSDKRNYNNEFHVKELYKNEFESLISNYFKNSTFLFQSYVNGTSIVLNEKNSNNINISTGSFDIVSSSSYEPMYLISIASDIKLKDNNISIFDGVKITTNSSKIKLNNKISDVKNTITFKTGRFILYPINLILKIFK